MERALRLNQNNCVNLISSQDFSCFLSISQPACNSQSLKCQRKRSTKRSFCNMANLKDDLDEYLIGTKASSSSFKIKMPKLPSFGGASTESTSSSSNSWLKDDDNGWCPKMSRIQRMIACVVCFGLGTFCLLVSFAYIPVLVFKARKFALLYSMASALFIAG